MMYVLCLTLFGMRGGPDHPQCNRGRLITHLLMMPGSALNNFIVLLVKIFQAKKKILKIGPLATEITFMQKIVRKPWYQIGLRNHERLELFQIAAKDNFLTDL